MFSRPLAAALLALHATSGAYAQTPAPGSIVPAGNTLVSAMMMFLGNEEKVYILDKAENNPAQINNHPAWGSVWDIATQNSTLMDVYSNTFCAAGMYLPNGSYAVFGGNHGVDPGPNGPMDVDPAVGPSPIYGDADGRKAIRIINPCTGSSAAFGDNCQWHENAADPTMVMQKERWYATAEPLGDGSIVLIGGMVNGGYINRLIGAKDPVTQDGVSQNNYEFYPQRPGFVATTFDFLVNAGGLNLYSHTYLMPSGKLFIQANISTALWDVDNNTVNMLPDMPNGIVRVYPASGATAMLPLTLDNNYTPTILFCGGNKFTDEEWGDQGGTHAQNWLAPASKDCQRITPEPTDNSAPVYVQDDDLPVGRTMGQFVLLPDGTMLLLNGGEFGTAAYLGTGTPYGQSLSTGPVFQPAIYDPNAPAGQRFSSAGLASSTIPRLYHSSAMLLPDGSVMIAGSNPNEDYNATTIYPTEMRVEVFYPPYFSKIASRPQVQGIPTTLTYGGPYFNLTLATAPSSTSKVYVSLVRGGFTTHAMNMGQRMMQLNSTVDGSTVHVSPPPPNSNLLTPGPAMLFVVVDGVPSVGKLLIVGSGKVETQQMLPVTPLPASRVAGSTGGGKGGSTSSDAKSGTSSTSLSHGAIIGIAVGGAGVALVALLAAFLFCCRRKKPSYVPVDHSATMPLAHGHDTEGEYAMLQRPQMPYAGDASYASSTTGVGREGAVTPYRDAPDGAAHFNGPYRDHTPGVSTDGVHRG